MKWWIYTLVLALKITGAAAYADGSLQAAYVQKDPLTALKFAYELNDLRIQNEASYHEVVQWLDEALVQRSAPSALHAPQPLFQPLLEWPKYANKSGLETYVGFIFFLGEHSQSDVLKHEYLRVVSTMADAVPAVLAESGWLAAEYVAQANRLAASRTWWQFFKELFMRRQDSQWFGNNPKMAEQNLREKEKELREIVTPYGDYFTMQHRGPYRFPYSDESLVRGVCAVSLQLMAKIGYRLSPVPAAFSK